MVFRSWMPYFSMLRCASANFTKASQAADWGSLTPITEKISPKAGRGASRQTEGLSVQLHKLCQTFWREVQTMHLYKNNKWWSWRLTPVCLGEIKESSEQPLRVFHQSYKGTKTWLPTARRTFWRVHKTMWWRPAYLCRALQFSPILPISWPVHL